MKLLEIKNTITSESVYINPEYIISIENEANGKTAITVQGGMTRTHRDYRTAEEIAQILKQLYVI